MSTLVAAFDAPSLPFAAGLALCAVACGLVLVGRLSIHRSAESKKWPQVEGVVLESAVAVRREDGRQRFLPVVRYRYEVGGVRYEGSRIGSAAPESFRKYTRARRVLDRYRSGSVIKVHYDPRRPGIAVLIPDSALPLRPLHLIALTAGAYALFAIGLAVAGY